MNKTNDRISPDVIAVDIEKLPDGDFQKTF